MNPSVYLAGPITGLTFDESTDWRKDVAHEFELVGIRAFSPLRCKQYLREYGALDNAGQPGGQYVGANPLSDPEGIMTRDRNDVTKRDMVLVNLLEADQVSIGSVMEIAWADMLRKPIVIAMEQDNIHRHGMVNQAAGFIVTDLWDAVEIVKAVLLP